MKTKAELQIALDKANDSIREIGIEAGQLGSVVSLLSEFDAENSTPEQLKSYILRLQVFSKPMVRHMAMIESQLGGDDYNYETDKELN